MILLIINLLLLSSDCGPYTQTAHPTPSYSGSYKILLSCFVLGENFATTLGILHSPLQMLGTLPRDGELRLGWGRRLDSPLALPSKSKDRRNSFI